jgi:hypothetical protein
VCVCLKFQFAVDSVSREQRTTVCVGGARARACLDTAIRPTAVLALSFSQGLKTHLDENTCKEGGATETTFIRLAAHALPLQDGVFAFWARRFFLKPPRGTYRLYRSALFHPSLQPNKQSTLVHPHPHTHTHTHHTLSLLFEERHHHHTLKHTHTNTHTHRTYPPCVSVHRLVVLFPRLQSLISLAP